MLKWHKPIKHVENVFLLFFMPSGEHMERCKRESRVTLDLWKKTKFHVIRKVYSQVIYTFFLYDSAKCGFSIFHWILVRWTERRGCLWRSSGRGLERSLCIALTFTSRLFFFMNNLMNQIFCALGPNERKKNRKMTEYGKLSWFYTSPRIFPTFSLNDVYHKS